MRSVCEWNWKKRKLLFYTKTTLEPEDMTRHPILNLKSLLVSILFQKYLSLYILKQLNLFLIITIVAIDGQVINWIESKALFGDEDAHRAYLKDQLYSYWNRYFSLFYQIKIYHFNFLFYRFGPGLVIYWFGYVKDLEKIHQNRTILIRDSLPSNIILMEQDPHCSS